MLKAIYRELSGETNGPNSSKQTCTQTDLACVVVDDEALVPAVEVFVGVDLDSQLLQHGLISSLAHSVHGGTHVIQDAHDTRGILGSQRKHLAFIFYMHQEVTSLDVTYREVDRIHIF